MRRHPETLSLVLVAGLGVLIPPALAATMATSFGVNASVVPNCRIAVSEPVPGDSSLDVVAELTVNCTRGVSARVLTSGAHPAPSGIVAEAGPRAARTVGYRRFRVAPRSPERWTDDTDARIVRTSAARAPLRIALQRGAVAARADMGGPYAGPLTATVDF
jgi:hypothetical protein